MYDNQLFNPKDIPDELLDCFEEVEVECGAPWVRVVEKGEAIQQHWSPGTQEKIDIAQGRHGKTSVMNTGYVAQKITTGWRPSCACDAPTARAIILDPFFGSGTTGRVAITHRRNFIGIELNDTYATQLTIDRLNGTQVRLL